VKEMIQIAEEQFNKQCEVYKKKNEYKKIIEEAKNFLECDRNNEEALFQLASAYYLSQQFTNAQSIIKKLVKIDENKSKYHITYGSILYERKKYEQGDEEFAIAFELDSSIVHGRTLYAGYLTQRDPKKFGDKIKKLCEYVLEKNPKDVSAYHYLALVYLEEENLYRAEDTIKKAIMMNPQDEYGHAYYGVILERKKELDLALKEYETCLQINPYIQIGPRYTHPQLARKYALLHQRSPLLCRLHKWKDAFLLSSYKLKYLLIPFVAVCIVAIIIWAVVKAVVTFCVSTCWLIVKTLYEICFILLIKTPYSAIKVLLFGEEEKRKEGEE
jgi:Tfp pilus assembly protein PilF